MVERVEHRDEIDRSPRGKCLQVRDIESDILQAQPARVPPCALDRHGAVVESGEINARMTARQLARDFARTAAKVEHRPHIAKMPRREVCKSADGQIPGVGGRERVVLERAEDAVVKLAIARSRPFRESPAKLAHRAGNPIPEPPESRREWCVCAGHPDQRAGF